MLRFFIGLVVLLDLLLGNIQPNVFQGIEHTYTYDALNRLIQKDGITLTYDANGNLIDDGTNAYEWDEKNRLVKVTTPNETVEYTYDAEDNRIAKIINGETTTYIVDTNTPYAQVITESKTDGTEIHYTYGNDLVGDGTHYFLTDALGSTRGLVDDVQTLTDSYDYKPYGELAIHTGTSENSFLFTGEQFDAETNNYYLRARYYSLTLTRFLSRDTYDGKASDPLSQNHYLYAGGNPIVYVDPSGYMFVATLGISSTLSSSFRSVRLATINRALMKELGCGLVEYSVESIIREGIYVFIADIDELRPGKPYAGRSKNVEKRLRQHINKRITDLNKGLILKLHLKGFTPRQIALIEDIVIEAIGGPKSRGGSAANRIGGFKPKYRGEREALKKAIKGLCK